ncbi:MAG: nucleotidyltransferase family protein [Burkholderiaceae bacterium]
MSERHERSNASSNAPSQALILAAGRGERMRPLTDTCPKPLLPVRGQPLIAWHAQALVQGGCTQLALNCAWLGDQIEAWAQGFAKAHASVQVAVSHEGRDFGGALETLGGICRALPLLDEVFWVVAGDVFVPGFVFSAEAMQRFAASGALAHLWLVPNPPHHPRGDFGIGPHGRALSAAPERLTFSTIALYRKALFAPPLCNIPAGNPDGIKAPLAPLLRAAMDNGAVTAELYRGAWTDVGTPQRLDELNAME